jgi:DNA primase
MQIYGLSFPEAVEQLANKLGIPVKHADGAPKAENREQRPEILAANEYALRFFMLNLKSAPAAVTEYCKARSLNAEVVESFAIGFAPLEWGALPQYLLKMGSVSRWPWLQAS